MSCKKLSDEEIEQTTFGYEDIKLKIPEETHCLIITTISNATDGTVNVQTHTITCDEIQEMKINEEI